MADLTQIKKTTLKMIVEQTIVQEHRPYLGMSQIGHSCTRYLWYSFRWAYTSELEARIIRLFNRGHREEPVIIETLNSVGIKVYNDQEEITDCHGHVKGHIDGRCIGVVEAPKTEHLAEFKTMSDKYFKQVCKEGVKVAKPIYFAQAQTYMHKLGLTRCLWVAVNKNDDQMYIERIHYDKDIAEELFRRAESIVLSEAPPDKQFVPTWYECKYCDARYICHQKGEIEVNCRTCTSCDLLPKGQWECSKHKILLTTSQQRLSCDSYNKLECL